MNGEFNEYAAQNLVNFDNILGSDANKDTILNEATTTLTEEQENNLVQLADRITETQPETQPETPQFVMPRKTRPLVKTHNVHRNDPCPCGSGKKYKNCCLPLGTYEGYTEQ